MDTNNSIDRDIPPYTDYAGFWLRFAAWLIDAVILNLANAFVLKPTLLLVGCHYPDVTTERVEEFMHLVKDDPITAQQISQSEMIEMLAGITITEYWVVLITSAIISWLYFALMESSAKQGTLGKMALRLHVTGMDGNRISFLRGTGRYFSKIPSAIILCIGYVMAGFTERKQALHDLMASTLVYRK